MCRQEGHYARDCPQMTDQKPTETRVERMQTLLRAMTPTERTKFKEYALNDEKKTRVERIQTLLRAMTPTERAKFKEYALNDEKRMKIKTPIIPLSRETSPHTNQTSIAVPPSRKTGPHASQMLEKLIKVLR